MSGIRKKIILRNHNDGNSDHFGQRSHVIQELKKNGKKNATRVVASVKILLQKSTTSTELLAFCIERHTAAASHLPARGHGVRVFAAEEQLTQYDVWNWYRIVRRFTWI